MNFEQLRSIVKNIKTRITCPGCEANYMNEDIHIVSSTDDKCVFMIKCHECETPVLVTASLNNQEVVGDQEEIFEIMQKNIEGDVEGALAQIQVDDVVNMHEFLKEFSGDFDQLFSSPKKD